MKTPSPLYIALFFLIFPVSTHATVLSTGDISLLTTYVNCCNPLTQASYLRYIETKTYSLSSASSPGHTDVTRYGIENATYDHHYSNVTSEVIVGDATASGHADAWSEAPPCMGCNNWTMEANLGTYTESQPRDSFNYSGVTYTIELEPGESIAFSELSFMLNNVALREPGAVLNFHASISGSSSSMDKYSGTIFDYTFSTPGSSGGDIDIDFYSDMTGQVSQVSSSDFAYNGATQEYNLDSHSLYIPGFDLSANSNTARLYITATSSVPDPNSPHSSSVPEPPVSMLFLLGLSALCLRRLGLNPLKT